MKPRQCPTCGRTYTNESLNYCLDDGSPLIYESVIYESPTAILSGETDRPPKSSEAGLSWPRFGTAGSKKLQAAIVGLLILAACGIGFYWFNNYRTRDAQIDSIAIMPFVNESGDPETEYLSDGMTETLISNLSKLPNLTVKPRSSVFRFKGKNADVKTLGNELNVEAVLNGTVVQRGSEISLHVELIDAAGDKVLWSADYKRPMAAILNVQSQIAQDVSDRLRTRLSTGDAQKLARNYTDNPEAYQLYLKGRYAWYKRTEKDLQRSAEYFQQAIVLDPNYSLAYAGLADTYAGNAVISFSNSADRLERLSKAREAATKALSLNPGLPEAHTAMGTLLVTLDFDFAGGEREYQRATELDPNHAEAHYWYALLLSRLGRNSEAISEMERALEIEPMNLVYRANRGGLLAWAGRYDDAIADLEKTLELDGRFAPTLGNLGNAYQFKRDYAKSIEIRSRELEANGNFDEASKMRDVFNKGGWNGYLRYVVQSRPSYVSYYGLAICNAGLGDKDEAFEALNRSYELRESLVQRLKVDPRLANLRDDPRFAELTKRMGLPQ